MFRMATQIKPAQIMTHTGGREAAALPGAAHRMWGREAAASAARLAELCSPTAQYESAAQVGPPRAGTSGSNVSVQGSQTSNALLLAGT